MSISDAVILFDSDICGSEDDSELDRSKKKRAAVVTDAIAVGGKDKRQNVLLKLLHRQRHGHFSNHIKTKTRMSPFPAVPFQLSYCLKDVIPCCYLDGHIFMGLSACGQFLISYKGSIDSFQFRSYDITALHRYELYFWIFRPHYPLHKFIRVCLFDDHGVDGAKKVTMTQWNTNSSVLIVHGESDSVDNDSYITYVRIPKLGCLNCRELRDEYFDGTIFREAMRCIKCAMTVHIKYRMGESAPNFNPSLNLNCPDFVIMSENTFIHAVKIELETRRHRDICTNTVNYRYTPTIGITRLQQENNDTESVLSEPIENSFEQRNELQSSLTIADEIIADFEEYETEGTKATVAIAPKTPELKPPAAPQNERRRTFFQKVETTPLPGCSASLHGSEAKNATKRLTNKDKINLYEFSEENEKCEKISIYRKRRLADKKYEFSEESLDNILPFNRIRDRVRCRIRSSQMSVTQQELGSHLHRSPSQGFRSPCGSPVGYRFLRSPPGFSSPSYQRSTQSSNIYGTPSGKYCPMGMLSPRQKRYEPMTIPCPLLSPNGREENLRRNLSSPVHHRMTGLESENNENHNSSNAVEMKMEKTEEPWKLACSKRFTRYFVEEDDANSVVTTEEDDCISPGYHTSLPLEVHGACYSDMQSISKASYSQLRHCSVVKITQNTFDTEAFTVHVASHVCNLNNKIYDMLSDSTYSIVHVCPITYTIICLMRIEFFANDILEDVEFDEVHKYSTRKMMRKKYSITPLFTWNIEDSSLHIITFGKLQALKNNTNCHNQLTPRLSKNLQKLLRSQINNFSHLRIHTADLTKTKERLTDLDNMVEFYRNNQCSDFSSSDSSDELSDTETSDIGHVNSS